MKAAWPWLAFLAIIGALQLITGLEVDWTTWKPATCMPNECFCEHLRDDWIRQPANTWSNMGFVLVGLLIIARPMPKTDTDAPLRDNWRFRVAYGLMAMFIGLGSWWYHASMSFAGQWFDVMGMYLLPTFLVAYNGVRLGRIAMRGFLSAWLLVNALLGLMLAFAAQLRRPVFAALLAILFASELYTGKKRIAVLTTKWLWSALFTFAVAWGIWNLDRHGIVCDPHSLAQGHAVWHLLCAVSTWLLYRYYCSARGPLHRPT